MEGIVCGEINVYHHCVQYLAYHALGARPVHIKHILTDAIRTIPLVRKEVGRHGKERVPMQSE